MVKLFSSGSYKELSVNDNLETHLSIQGLSRHLQDYHKAHSFYQHTQEDLGYSMRKSLQEGVIGEFLDIIKLYLQEIGMPRDHINDSELRVDGVDLTFNPRSVNPSDIERAGIDVYVPHLQFKQETDTSFTVRSIIERQGNYRLVCIFDALNILYPLHFNELSMPAVQRGYLPYNSNECIIIAPASNLGEFVDQTLHLSRSMYPKLEELTKSREHFNEAKKTFQQQQSALNEVAMHLAKRDYLDRLLGAMGRNIS